MRHISGHILNFKTIQLRGGHRPNCLTLLSGDFPWGQCTFKERDWSGEVSSFARDVAEMALAHTIENKVEAAYRRGDLFEKRSVMMQDWANYLS